MPDAGWYLDPTGRFDRRYFNGTVWTDEVTRDATQERLHDPQGAPPMEAVGTGTEDRRAKIEAKLEARKQAKQETRAAKKEDKSIRDFWASPAGRARTAFNAGDHVFQYSLDVLSQQAVIVAMVGSTTSKRTVDPTTVLNTVAREGWELVNGDFVFVTQGQQSRDKFMSSGQNISVKGTVIGYYLFKRNEAIRVPETDEELLQRIAGYSPPALDQAAEDADG